ncbi:MAG: heterodisulfide reductase-related iron-sulfur binding cluster [Chloroflexota bacterium]
MTDQGLPAQSPSDAGTGGYESFVRPAFDAYHPPSSELIDDCVHCGFCLPSCPTYVLFGEEMDSPRGRIHLMKQGLEGEPLTAGVVSHFDLCLGCLACVTACPSGVQYEKLIESTRQQVERRHPRPFSDRAFRELIYRLFPYPRRLRFLMPLLQLYQRSGVRALVKHVGAFQRLPPRFQALENLMPPAPARREAIPEWTPARGVERKRVGVLLGCVQRSFFPQVNAATVRVLAAEGCTVGAPRGQGCCGALSLHAGREAEAIRFARRTIDSFEQAEVDAVVVNVAGCGSAMKEYGYLLRDDPIYGERARRFAAMVRNASEFVQEIGPLAKRHPVACTVVYHDACHLQHGQGIRDQPREILRQIPDLVLKEVPRERDICCGSAGTYNLLEPEPARELGERKAESVWAAGADLLVTANPGCHLQIQAALRRAGRDLPAFHVMELVDASIRGESVERLFNADRTGFSPAAAPARPAVPGSPP